MPKIKIGILGGAGYTGGELLRILIHHPQAEIVFVHSKSKFGSYISSVHQDLIGETKLKFTNATNKPVDVIFLCVGHGEAQKILAEHNFPVQVKIIDLSQDFRINEAGNSTFVYGLPELNKGSIETANNIANPGCFATAIQLALLPLLEKELIDSDIHISATTGSTGAGQALSESSHFSWRENNLSVYKAFTHQHLREIKQSIKQVQTNFSNEIIFVPQRGAFPRGILAAVTIKSKQKQEFLLKLYQSYYEAHPFVFLSKENVALKQVINTNKCLLYLEKNENQLLIVSVIDNLLKGASGQAVQNMNLMFGLSETTGLKLKASAF